MRPVNHLRQLVLFVFMHYYHAINLMLAVLFQPNVLYQFDEMKISRLMDFGLDGKRKQIDLSVSDDGD